MIGMVGNNVESVKFIGKRDLNMDTNMKAIFDESDIYHFYPYYNDAKELFENVLWVRLAKFFRNVSFPGHKTDF